MIEGLLIFFSLLIRLLAIGSASLIAEEAYYWNYTNHLDFGYLDHPPMVAVLIKLSTLLFGVNEFGVRFPAIVCWALCTFFVCKLTKIMAPNGWQKAILLMSILPFFFLHSLIITPDLPLIAAWSACLYFLYRALVLQQSKAWYPAGICLGLGLLSKYTIILLVPATLIYILIVPESRSQLRSFYPYLALFIAGIIFSPVIYWNATHEWASFAFQSTRRFSALDQGSLLAFWGLLLLFLTPVGLIGFGQLLLARTKKNANTLAMVTMNVPQTGFMQCFTLTPLVFFASFSLTHAIKFNWIGPALIGVIPWLSAIATEVSRVQKAWLWSGVVLLLSYAAFLVCLISGKPEVINHALLTKYIDWNDFNHQVHDIAWQVQKTWHKPVILMPLDRYNIASELSFYQKRTRMQGKTKVIFPVMGAEYFGYESLMYRYWSDMRDIDGKIVLLIAENPAYLEYAAKKENIAPLSPLQPFWSHSQGHGQRVIPYYYQAVTIS